MPFGELQTASRRELFNVELIAGCKGRIETIEMWFGSDHGEELQLVKYQMSISHSVLVQSLFTGLFYF